MNRLKFKAFHPTIGMSEPFMFNEAPKWKNGQSIINWIDECTILQSVGLEDVDNQEIYDKDIVRCFGYNPDIMTVDFREGGYCLVTDDDSWPIDINHFYPSIGCQIKVIGNKLQSKDF
jgi:uncharacterized phage protein (TIGR01671 family)